MRLHNSACEGLFLPARLLSRSVSRCAAARDRAVRRASGAPEHHCHHDASFTCARAAQLHKHHTLLPRYPPSTAATLMSALVVLAMAAVADGATLFFSQFQEASSGNNK